MNFSGIKMRGRNHLRYFVVAHSACRLEVRECEKSERCDNGDEKLLKRKTRAKKRDEGRGTWGVQELTEM